MVNIGEWFKGTSIFLVLTLLIYFAYDTIIKGILNWVTQVSPTLGAVGWVGFIILYIVCCPLYLYYTIIAGAKDEETQPMWILAGFSSFFLFLIIAAAINMIFIGYGGADGLIDVVSQATEAISGESFETLDKISFLAILVTVLGCIATPFGLVLKGYGKMPTKQDLGLQNE